MRRYPAARRTSCTASYSRRGYRKEMERSSLGRARSQANRELRPMRRRELDPRLSPTVGGLELDAHRSLPGQVNLEIIFFLSGTTEQEHKRIVGREVLQLK